MDFSVMGEGAAKAAIDTSALGRYSISTDAVKRALEQKDIARLRQFSQYFYHNSGEYRRLVDYFGNMLTNDYIVIPTEEKGNTEKRFVKILEYTENSNIKETCNSIGQIVVRDGAYFGYERDLNGRITMQQLPTSHCRSRFKVYGVYAVEFDFGFFDQYRGEDLDEMLDAFPEEFTGMYATYLGDRTNERWQMLDPVFARAHMLEDAVPMLSPVFIDLIELEEYKRMEKRKAKLELYKLIIQKIPLDSNNELTFTLDELKQFHSNIRKLIRDTEIDVVTTPCDVESVDLQDRMQVDRDNVKNATNMIYSTAGTPMILFSGADGSAGIKASVQVDENTMFPLLQQYERWYQNKFETIAKVGCKVIFPPITHFNRKDMMDLYSAGATQGFPTKMLVMAALGISQYSMDALLRYENEILKLHERMIPTSSSYQMPGEDEGGRPESKEPLSDEGEKTKDDRKNDGRKGE